ncbi:MAG: hypothetical protein QME87_09955 [Bacillota bacterium]|nr:hypothetical protein [Bacillota bacterium]
MAERIPATLRVGGSITREQYEEIKRLIEQEGDPFLSMVEPDSLVCEADDAPWGRFEELEEYLVQHGIPFDRHTEAKYEYDAVLRVFRPGALDEEVPANQDGNIVVLAEDIRQAIAATKTRKALVHRLEEIIRASVPLPPLVVRD